MPAARTEPMHRAHHLSLHWGALLMAAATFLAAFLPAVALLVLGFDPGWAAAAMVAGFVTIWGLTIVLARRSARRESTADDASGEAACPHCGRSREPDQRN